jgi:hypothetical protein
MNTLGPTAGLLGFVVTIFGLIMGGTKEKDSKTVLFWGIGLIIFGIISGNGLLDN